MLFEPISTLSISWCTFARLLVLGFPGDTLVENPPASVRGEGVWLQSLGREDPLKQEMASH